VISCDARRIVEQSHVTSASERNCGATANYIMVEQSYGTSASERYCGATGDRVSVLLPETNGGRDGLCRNEVYSEILD
jgi:hypothetical protein